jgi:hypothetical protein
MTGVTELRPATRRQAMQQARQSRRPSRLGCPAGTADPGPGQDPSAGFPRLLEQVWEAAGGRGLPGAVDLLLTLDGRVPADVSLRALTVADECAAEALFGLSWRDGRTRASADRTDSAHPAFLGALGLTRGGRLVVGVPSRGLTTPPDELVGGVMRVPWSAAALDRYSELLSHARSRQRAALSDCRAWLAALGDDARDELLQELREAALRTAPFVLYQGDHRYTNFRERNNLTGKTLWAAHPDCALVRLDGVPLELWADGDVTATVCLTLLVRSAGFARIEEANGTQLTLDHVAFLLERTRRTYDDAGGPAVPPPARSAGVADLHDLAVALSTHRRRLGEHVQLYREIHGALMHKVERAARPLGSRVGKRERRLCRRLSQQLPVAGGSVADLKDALAADPAWLTVPLGEHATGFEALVHATVDGARQAFEADFAMSRGLRALVRLQQAMRRQDWAEIASWELPAYYCCVVAAPDAPRLFEGSADRVADAAWAMSSRMQYNSWHFIAGNLPRTPPVVARDYFVPPTIPDLAYFSDQHHRGHVAARVRFSIRSPQAVTILGRRFHGFVDLRLLRCEGHPFTEDDLLQAHRVSGLVATATELLGNLVAAGASCEVTAFDSAWHWRQVTGASTPRREHSHDDHGDSHDDSHDDSRVGSRLCPAHDLRVERDA